jgi:hypothetical protein
MEKLCHEELITKSEEPIGLIKEALKDIKLPINKIRIIETETPLRELTTFDKECKPIKENTYKITYGKEEKIEAWLRDERGRDKTILTKMKYQKFKKKKRRRQIFETKEEVNSIRKNPDQKLHEEENMKQQFIKVKNTKDDINAEMNRNNSKTIQEKTH